MTTTDTDPWHVPPAPPAPLAETLAQYAPAREWATIAAPAEDVQLDDVIDHTSGLMVVTEITRRRGVWTLGGYNPASPPPFYWQLGNGADRPPLTRDLTAQPRIRARRRITAWPRLPGHTKTVASHNPQRSGCYTLVEGYDASCSCGWTAPEIYKHRGGAETSVGRHRAEVITRRTHDELPSLAAIERVEAELGDLLPWQFDHGAQARLHGLTTASSLTRLDRWATALGSRIEHLSANEHGLSGRHFLWVDSRVEEHPADIPAVDIRAFPTDTTTGATA